MGECNKRLRSRGDSGRLPACQLEPALHLLTSRVMPNPTCNSQGRGGPGFVAVPGALFVVAGFAGHETNDVHRSAARLPACRLFSAAGCRFARAHLC